MRNGNFDSVLDLFVTHFFRKLRSILDSISDGHVTKQIRIEFLREVEAELAGLLQLDLSINHLLQI